MPTASVEDESAVTKQAAPREHTMFVGVEDESTDVRSGSKRPGMEVDLAVGLRGEAGENGKDATLASRVFRLRPGEPQQIGGGEKLVSWAAQPERTDEGAGIALADISLAFRVASDSTNHLTVRTEVTIEDGDEGVIFGCGGQNGAALYVSNGTLHWISGESGSLTSAATRAKLSWDVPAGGGRYVIEATTHVNKPEAPYALLWVDGQVVDTRETLIETSRVTGSADAGFGVGDVGSSRVQDFGAFTGYIHTATYWNGGFSAEGTGAITSAPTVDRAENRELLECAEAGTYDFRATVAQHSTNIRTNVSIRFVVNGEPVAPYGAGGYIRDASGHNHSSVQAHRYLDLQEGDRVAVECFPQGSGGAVALVPEGSLLEARRLA